MGVSSQGDSDTNNEIENHKSTKNEGSIEGERSENEQVVGTAKVRQHEARWPKSRTGENRAQRRSTQDDENECSQRQKVVG